VQKIASILLICLFALSQYAKQLSYIECKLSNNFKAENAKCDCETKLAQDTSSAPDQPANTTHFHLHADEIYFIEQFSDNKQCLVAISKLNSRYPNAESDGFTDLPLQH
jgi:hypothetical protein